MPRLSKIGAAALAAFGWTSGSSVTASYLVVAGAGSGGYGGGGGGAGGLLTGTASLNPTQSYTVTVGAGGAGVGVSSGNAGSNSVFNSVTANGGGFGATYNAAGGSGGSGGGGGANNQAGGTATSGQGNNGGAGGANSAVYSAGGGGGASAVGGTGNSSGAAGSGGNGTASSISGSSVTYAGGGGGSNANGSGGTAGSGGTGGGGAGSVTGSGTAGTANLGGGGGGAWAGGGGSSGKGGSGVVIISYVGAQQFGGGTVTSDGTNTIHTFTTSGTLSPLSSLTAQYLVVGGGGGGSGGNGGSPAAGAGGGGSGGYRTSTGLIIDTNSNYVVTVGAGGSAGVDNGLGTSGSDSLFLSITSTGGGRGGSTGGVNGLDGGSGGGGQGKNSGAGGAGNTPSTSPSQGSNGGAGGTSVGGGGGGGGGASATGTTATSASGGAGGAGTASSLSGTSVTYAGGGGGGNQSSGSGGTGGSGGGGTGGTNAVGTAGTANLGGGGGGGGVTTSNTGFAGGNGGSGVVIIAYPGATQQMAGGTVTISGGNVIHTFTASGYLTPIKYASRSLRFRSSASAYISRTPTATTNRRTWTWSGWVKRGALGSVTRFFSADNGAQQTLLRFQADNTLQFQIYNSGVAAQIITTQVFRDPSAWYHIVAVMNTTDATSANRMVLYINGVQVTALSTASYPSQNYDAFVNQTILHSTSSSGTAEYWDGYLTEVNFIDGAALTPSSFGTFNSYGVWQPITYGGSYGTNGFYLTFGNNTSTTTLGYDTSPQGNNWTTNNISLTAGVTYDSMTDVPTLTSSTANNYCVLNPLITDYTNGSGPVVVQNGNLQLYRPSASGWGMCGSTFGVSSGKWYWEAINTGSNCVLGIHKTQPTTYFAIVGYNEPNGYGYGNDGNKLNNNTGSAYGATYANGDVIGMALDMDAGTLTFYKNNTSQGVAFSGLSGTFAPAFSCAGLSYWDANFGQQGFVYTPPSGFVALNTYNLSTPTIPNGAVYMAATTYTGNGTSQSINNSVNGTSFQPDFVWYKDRSVARDHALFNVTSGATYLMSSNNASAESAVAGTLTSFNSNGYSIGSTSNANGNGETYVGWQWKANGTGASNTSGTLTSTVSANTTAGFAVCTYTAPASSQVNTFGHGLGVAPSMVIAKNRSSGTGGLGWAVYHISLGVNQYLGLNSTAAASTSSGYWGSGMTSTVVSLQTAASSSGTDNVTGNMVAYVFAAIAGYSAIGTYTGNGSADGVFVFLGFRARFLMIKRTDSTGGWVLLDTARDTYNDVDNYLYANSSAADAGSSNVLDINSNGFKIRNSWTDINASGGTYIYAAFAENPFKYSNAR